MTESLTKQMWNAWDKGECFFGPLGEALLKIPKGQHVSKEALEILEKYTICPIGNASCLEFEEITVSGICPPRSGCHILEKKIRICKIGCDAKSCILNK